MIRNLERFNAIMSSAVPEYRGYKLIEHGGSKMLRLDFEVDNSLGANAKTSYLSLDALARAENTIDFLRLAELSLSYAYASDEAVAARHIRGLLESRGYFPLVEIWQETMRVWFSSKKTKKAYFCSVDKAVAGRIARGEEDAVDLVEAATKFAEKA